AETKGPDVAAGQKIATQVCAACHGVNGQSPLPANPHIAGQHYDYLVKQLVDFKANKERKNAVMMSMAQPLSADDVRSVAAHYASQKPRAGAAANKQLINLGQKLYRGGNPATGVPACAGCHAPNGAGIPAQYPRLSGQFVEYTVAQLKAFRSLERANDPNQMMRAIAARMTDQEIAAVAEYISGLQ
ncbi:MAG: cytochrome c4, partial [Betaproteobacteria bacterium]